MSDKWVVERIEADGSNTRTVELPDQEAHTRYANWCENAKRFNDRSISLIQVERIEKILSTHTNTKFDGVPSE